MILSTVKPTFGWSTNNPSANLPGVKPWEWPELSHFFYNPLESYTECNRGLFLQFYADSLITYRMCTSNGTWLLSDFQDVPWQDVNACVPEKDEELEEQSQEEELVNIFYRTVVGSSPVRGRIGYIPNPPVSLFYFEKDCTSSINKSNVE